MKLKFIKQHTMQQEKHGQSKKHRYTKDDLVVNKHGKITLSAVRKM